MSSTKYSDLLADWLVAQGYTTFFFVAGGNIMHLLDSCRKRMRGIPVMHEVAAGIATEYFNESNPNGDKAFAMVTAGPGLTNILTAMAGAYLESRELLVLGGQVKTADLSLGQLRQRGIQEIDGVALARPVAVTSVLMTHAVSQAEFNRLIQSSTAENIRKGPVFLELPLDVQGATVDSQVFSNAGQVSLPSVVQEPLADDVVATILEQLGEAERPVILIGGGVSRATVRTLLPRLETLRIPLMTTWNGMDRLAADHPLYMGRPNTWGQRSANILLQQSDCVLALGTRLGLQQTGFNWQAFAPLANVIQVDCDAAELLKGHPRLSHGIGTDANRFLDRLLAGHPAVDCSQWLTFCTRTRDLLPLVESNVTGEGYLSPFRFVEALSVICEPTDCIIPCSSGGAFTTMMQIFAQQSGQTVVTNKGLASMGYGLSGAIGAAFANPASRVILVEGDGGFAQNLQEIGTAAVNHLNIKLFIYNDNGYASIRMTQKNYFGGDYIGCDIATGVGLPEWVTLFSAWKVPCFNLVNDFATNPEFVTLFNQPGPAAFLVPIDPAQTYFPKITSQVSATGGMISNPLHRMSPDLPPDLEAQVLPYLSNLVSHQLQPSK